jgi:NAD(P)H-hydrate epimerase
MNTETFDKSWFSKSRTLKGISDKYNSGQVTVIGGSRLFHGAPLLALKSVSRIIGMTYFSSPDEDKEIASRIKSELLNFIWVPFDDVDNYVSKTDVVLIGPGMMRSHIREHDYTCDDEGGKTRRFSEKLFRKFPEKMWVVDGGTLQVVGPDVLPKRAVISPNHKEFEMMFGEKLKTNIDERAVQIFEFARKYNLTILSKDEISLVSDGERTIKIEGGNDGLVKGGVGDVIAGVLTGFLVRDTSVFACAAASYLVKKAAERLAETRGLMFNADDLVDMVPVVWGEICVQG